MPAPRRPLAAGALLGGVVLGAVGFWASPAAAHAILLRTEPSPQTTVKSAPAAIHLHFSEPVEVTFGAVRVFDVDGRRVDPGTIRRAEGNREVVLPVRLQNGTYTVTWRVTSADGHPVRGGFAFYVGSPSTISAVAVPAEEGPGRAVAWGYGVARFAWFGAVLGLVGLVVVRRWVWTPAVQVAGMGRSPAADRFRHGFRRAFPATWAVLLVAGLAILVFQAATVSGLPVADSARPAVLGDLLGTEFGRLWLGQMALAVALGLPVAALVARRPVLGLRPQAWIAVFGVVAAGLSLVTALNGHARTLGRAPAMVPTLAVHLLAVGVWVGGLGALVMLAGASWRRVGEADRPVLLRQLVTRFTRVAVWAAGVVVVTGVVSAYGDFGAVSDLWDVSHGRAVAAKVALVAIALAFAWRHRVHIPRRLAQPALARAAVASFRRTSAAELVVLLGAVGVAAGLVSLVPGRSLALAAKGPVNQERRAGAYTVQLFVDPTRVGDNEFHVTFVDDRGLAAAEIANSEVALGPAGGDLRPVAMRLISPGHFVGDAPLPAPGRYRLSVAAPGAPGTATTFDFRLHKES